ncbi:bifunctional 4-hydroxy-2-oxoglutarate aldolase/2-dehydro-3-deoxy-phosphogluconate aldolase [Acetomicrobium hydrogeniformans]|jgi:2-dehydro-3-deoxyphosphogluconate aldolase/(4S)-4-hydroxy-2-oxoglutarate aldolase|uniref:Putative 2-dehydro-3-deoxy-6-phosphogalactonate aldolase n=1 Tax=Acetomicrobium hydrogeniformans ATCC BAA-1850 TaxID=592015 RepID=A0A0T5X9N3_9BACT|nr:bifunctional 4-hydroxy-2-oxoglutarate aldolase/2-dehydro-3-deoxy-phosphogluconate aldolase [Acetomicrobium hydrogeniformans]KRT35049.1 putative 2-dehydro-3-deoxy-6-phosphogalactonate aldolase [Acetomicrobium hydrogeniformans ATCC BAA-1850]
MFDTINYICSAKVIAVIRAKSANEGLRLCKAIHNGGIKTIEVTMTVPKAINTIETLQEEMLGQDVLIGAGTVCDSETAVACIKAGAKFIVSPCLVPDVIHACHRYNVLVMPGIGTATEAFMATQLGAQLLKVFPGDVLGPHFVKSLKGPFPHLKMIPTGGVTLENMDQWFKAGVVAVGIGSFLTRPAIEKGDFNVVTSIAKEVVAKAMSL